MFEPKYIQRWTRPQSYAGETWPNYYVAGVGQNRDSDCLSQSNFAAMLKLLGGESKTVIVVHEGHWHWAVGWIEWIAIDQDDETALRIADDARGQLDDYPVLDEDDWSEREQKDANATWLACYNVFDRIAYIREHRSQFEFHSLADMIACVRGQFFNGYASELIS